MRQTSLVAAGEILVDFTPFGRSPDGSPLFEQNPGGAPANLLTCFRRLGGESAFIGVVGDDVFGLFLEDVLKKSGISVSGLKKTSKAQTTLAFVHLSEGGDRSFSFYRSPGADTLLTPSDIQFSLLGDTSIFHFGSLSLTHEPSRSSILLAVKHARRQGKIISYDPNWRESVWSSPKTGLHWMRHGLDFADIVKVSDEEAMLLTDCPDYIAAAASLLEGTPLLILVTLGERGCYFAHASGAGLVPTYDTQVVDTTGCGDAFFGAFLYQFLETGVGLCDLTPPLLTQLVRFANASGALCATRRGAVPAMPGLEEIHRCMKMT